MCFVHRITVVASAMCRLFNFANIFLYQTFLVLFCIAAANWEMYTINLKRTITSGLLYSVSEKQNHTHGFVGLTWDNPTSLARYGVYH